MALDIAATDADEDDLTYSVAVNSGEVTAALVNNKLTLTPADDWSGTANITVSVDDGNGLDDSEIFTLNVTEVNDAPELDPIGAQSTNEDVTKTITLTATDAEEDVLTFEVTSASSNITASISGTTLSLVPASNWSGSGEITVTVEDPDEAQATETFTLTVNAFNDAPELAQIGNLTTPEDTPLNILLSASDVENDTITFSASVNSGNVSTVVAGNQVIFNPEADWFGDAVITIAASDGNGGTDSETFTLSVIAVNDAPVLTAIGNKSTNKSVPLTFFLASTNIEEDDVTYSASVSSGSVSAIVSGTQITLAPAALWSGIATVIVTVDDGNGGTDSETFSLSVLDTNIPPELDAIADQTTNEDTPSTVP